ncbi:MAG: hypothetical protein QMD85_02700, partial [Candidatus Aenigmarchaeota archaeon]|nr:hypothetical protein [Candidatus Aenigmarchaeota archaeon]MDI6722462.1 hypothetical protein [Candidatus Aenigmarchaeota archaeon]
MPKHLFRVMDENCYEQSYSFCVSDSSISPYMNIHVIPIIGCSRKLVYGRDLISEWRDTLFVKKELFHNPCFMDHMRSAG